MKLDPLHEALIAIKGIDMHIQTNIINNMSLGPISQGALRKELGVIVEKILEHTCETIDDPKLKITRKITLDGGPG